MEPKIGTPFSSSATKVMLCGSGELGKEVVIEFQRLGVEVIAVDSYKNAPAQQVADHAFVINMLDSQQLKDVINQCKPDIIVPEIEAIATDVLVEAEKNGNAIAQVQYLERAVAMAMAARRMFGHIQDGARRSAAHQSLNQLDDALKRCQEGCVAAVYSSK